MPYTAPSAKRGFTLIEMLIVVVVIGILAAIAIPKFTETKGRSYAGTLKSDLRNLAGQQENYFSANDTYGGGLPALGFAGSPGVVLTITESSGTGWSATATHPSADPLICSVFYGSAAVVAPATQAGTVDCQ